jgi:hypothetical protein
MKRPSETLIHFFLENLESLKENQRNNFHLLDQLVLWIVGLSIGGLSLILINLTDLAQFFSYIILKISIILLVISLISGISFRCFCYLLQLEFQKAEFYLRGALTDKNFMQNDPSQIDNENDINEIIRQFKNDFDEDLSFELQNYNDASESHKLVIITSLKNHYKKISEWSKKDFELGQQFINDTFQKAFGLSKKEYSIFNNPNRPNRSSQYAKACFYLFLACCVSFTFAIILALANF